MSEHHWDFFDQALSQIQKLIARIIDNSRYLLHKSVHADVDLAQLIHEVLDLFSGKLSDVKVSFSADTSLRTDAFLIEHILINLIENALKFASPDRSLELTITATRLVDRVDIAVSDNGVGVDTSESLADMFVRGNHEKPGHGVGLALVVSMAQQLGGELSWDVNPQGFGTVFTLCLPLADENKAD